MQLPVFVLCALATLLVAETSVSGAVVEVPDQWLFGPEAAYAPGNLLREKRQFALSGGGSGRAGTVRLDGQRNLFDNGRTRVDGKGYVAHSWQPGAPSHTSGGLGAGVSHEVWRGRGGQSLSVQGGYQRNFNTPDKHNFNTGLTYRF